MGLIRRADTVLAWLIIAALIVVGVGPAAAAQTGSTYTYEAPSNSSPLATADGVELAPPIGMVSRVAATGQLSGRELRLPAILVAPGSLADDVARLGDDVLASADDAFTHGYDYAPRIRGRGLQDPVGHNFPYSFDDAILQTAPIRQADGSLLYQATGTLNGKAGVFEIALNTDTSTIFHRTFRGG